jgi:DNA polymerase (family X)
MDKKEVSRTLEDIGTLLELKGENPFKTRAYHNAARAIAAVSGPIENMVLRGEIGNLKGIGEALSKKITELVTTGGLKYYDDLKTSIPPGLVEMLAIPRLGPKKIKVLYDQMQIVTIGELDYACHENRLLKLPGFGKKTQDQIIEGIEFIRKHSGEHLFNVALSQAEIILHELGKLKCIQRLSLAGGLRRRKELVHDIDLVCSTKNGAEVMDRFTSMLSVEEVIAKGDTKSTVRMDTGITADLRIISDEQFPYALHHSTGSKEHNVAMRSRAKERGLKMNEYGLFKGTKNLPCRDEAEIYAKLGLQYIPPEMREEMGEIDAAEKGCLPKLVEEQDLKGLFHVHSTWSDGANTIEEMALAAQKAGYSWIGIADHSEVASYAHGVKKSDLPKQYQEIDSINDRMKNFHIFKGSEVDILDGGKLDYDDKTLRGLDFIVIAVHSRFNMTEKEMTSRIIQAMENDYFTILAHPTGRLLLARDSYPIDIRKVIQAAASTSTVIEINANPHRFDLDWRQCQYAKELGVKLSINPDAHRTDGIGDMKYGLGIARKGWLETSDLLNCLTTEQIKTMLNV